MLESSQPKTRCTCGASVAAITGSTHRYMSSHPGCWAAYGKVLALEFADARFASHHRLTVDAYAVQHPGVRSPQTVQSVAVHLISLLLVLERRLRPEAATRALRDVVRHRYRWLEPPTHFGDITVADLQLELEPARHAQQVIDWAASAWDAWSAHRSQIEVWANATSAHCG